jgi:polysaccharide biosynthesis protein PslH
VSARPTLLFVSPRFLLPVDCGAKIRTTQILRGLKGGRFEVVLASPATARELERFGRALGELCDRLVTWPARPRGPLFHLTRMRHIVRDVPIPIATDWSEEGHRVIAAELARRPDCVVFDFLHSAVLWPGPLGAPAVLFTHNVEAEIFRRHRELARSPVYRWVWTDQTAKMERFERDTLRRFDAVVAVSDRDRLAFARDYGVDTARVIPTGVDLDYFSYGEPSPAPTVVFSGSMDWIANIDAMQFYMEEIWPRIVAQLPEATMTVVGRSPPASLVRQAADRGFAWHFTGFVDDVRPCVRAAGAYVIPLRVGGGTRLKVFEAMASGCPVVSTSIGVEGLPVREGEHWLRGDDPDAFAAAVVRVLRDRALQLRLAGQARAWVEAHAGFRAAARVFESICADAMQPAERPTVAACAT